MFATLSKRNKGGARVNKITITAEVDLEQQEIARAIKNLQRANLALSRIFNLEEEEDGE